MAKITVPEENRPSFRKYVAYTVIGVVLVNAVVGMLTQDVETHVIRLGAILVAGVVNVAILFLMVQSLVEEWFDAAEITRE